MKKPRSTPAAPTQAASATPAASSKPSPFQAFLAGGEEPITVTLSGPTSALVRWYCATTKHREEATADGVVFGALTRAKESYAEDSFDEGFNFVVEDVLDCMNSFRLREHSRRGFLSVELDHQASGTALDYAHRTGADPRDVVNTAVLAEVPHVLDQLTKGQEDDDGPAVMREQVAAAMRRRTGEEAATAPVALSPLPASPPAGATHTMTLEFSAEALALLEAARVNDGFDSIEDFIRVNTAGAIAAFCASLDSEKMTRELFAAPGTE